MFYRRKIILALLEALGGELSRTDFQKHLLLFTRKQEQPAFDFVPYRFGGFSFGADADRAPMIMAGLLRDEQTWAKKATKSYVAALTPDDRERLREHQHRYGHLRGCSLVRAVYLTHPFYATRSEIVGEVLNKREQEAILAVTPKVYGSALLTVGYEGRSVERYMNVLIGHGVRVLCDVRANPVSRKFGFSKSRLRSTAERLGIAYLHIPELGIVSGKRKALDSRGAYARLFDEYEQTTLPHREAELGRIARLVNEHSRVALTCFEACHSDCHRSRVADALRRRPQWSHPVIHV